MIGQYTLDLRVNSIRDTGAPPQLAGLHIGPTTYRLPTGTLTVYSISTKAHTSWLRNSFSWHAVADICCLRQQNVVFHYLHNLPLSKKLDPRLPICYMYIILLDSTYDDASGPTQNHTSAMPLCTCLHLVNICTTVCIVSCCPHNTTPPPLFPYYLPPLLICHVGLATSPSYSLSRVVAVKFPLTKTSYLLCAINYCRVFRIQPLRYFQCITLLFSGVSYLLTYARLLTGSMGHRSKLSTGFCAVPA